MSSFVVHKSKVRVKLFRLREISCSFCAFGCLNKAQMTMHMAELHKLKVHRNEGKFWDECWKLHTIFSYIYKYLFIVVRNNQKSAFDDSSDNDSSTVIILHSFQKVYLFCLIKTCDAIYFRVTKNATQSSHSSKFQLKKNKCVKFCKHMSLH